MCVLGRRWFLLTCLLLCLDDAGFLSLACCCFFSSKTLLARELARILGAREPQIVNGPEILDKFIGEAEKKVRDLFAPAERECTHMNYLLSIYWSLLDD